MKNNEERIQNYLDGLSDEEFDQIFIDAGFEIIAGTGKIIDQEESHFSVPGEISNEVKYSFKSKPSQFYFFDLGKKIA